MPELDWFGRLLVALGVILVVAGLLFLLAGRLSVGEGFRWVPFRLPGDIYIRRGNFTFFFPITTGIIISIILTIVFRLLGRH